MLRLGIIYILCCGTIHLAPSPDSTTGHDGKVQTASKDAPFDKGKFPEMTWEIEQVFQDGKAQDIRAGALAFAYGENSLGECPGSVAAVHGRRLSIMGKANRVSISCLISATACPLQVPFTPANLH